MAINRVKSPYSQGYFGPFYAEAAYAPTGGTITTFVATGANPQNVVGATYRVHEFATTGTYSMQFTKPGAVDILVIGGGGTGGYSHNGNAGGGGGAGGVIQLYGLGVLDTTYSITVGTGGTAGHTTTANGNNSSFGGYIAWGGGQGVYWQPSVAGGSVGGASGGAIVNPIDVNQGNKSATVPTNANGGGGAGQSSAGAGGTGAYSAAGGRGIDIAFKDNTVITYAGGGGGAISGAGGLGGGGAAGASQQTGQSATFYGGGGGGGYWSSNNSYRDGGSGYQGLVIVRYRVS